MRATRADGPLIRQMREQSGSGLSAFAFRVRISASHLSRIETGIANPSPEILARIAGQLGVTIPKISTPTADLQRAAS